MLRLKDPQVGLANRTTGAVPDVYAQKPVQHRLYRFEPKFGGRIDAAFGSQLRLQEAYEDRNWPS